MAGLLFVPEGDGPFYPGGGYIGLQAPPFAATAFPAVVHRTHVTQFTGETIMAIDEVPVNNQPVV